jgi:hypothetical protein
MIWRHFALQHPIASIKKDCLRCYNSYPSFIAQAGKFASRWDRCRLADQLETTSFADTSAFIVINPKVSLLVCPSHRSNRHTGRLGSDQTSVTGAKLNSSQILYTRFASSGRGLILTGVI